MEAFTLDEILARQQLEHRRYLEFLRKPALSVGVYTLPAGGVDPQQPHTEDEVYVVLDGRAQLTVGEETQTVARGSIVFVAADAVHRFHDIAETLTVLVFFAPAEGSRQQTKETAV